MEQCKQCGNFTEDGECLECLGQWIKGNLSESDLDNIVESLLGKDGWKIIIEDNRRHQEKPDRSN